MWILIFYISSGYGSAMTGGSLVIENFKTEPACVYAGESIKLKVKKADWYSCVLINK